MKCANCGGLLPEGCRFCRYCGVRLTPVSEAPEKETHAEEPVREIPVPEEPVQKEPETPAPEEPVWKEPETPTPEEPKPAGEEKPDEVRGNTPTGESDAPPAGVPAENGGAQAPSPAAARRQPSGAATRIPLIVCAVLLVISLAANVWLYMQGSSHSGTISSQQEEISALEADVAELQESVMRKEEQIASQRSTISSLQAKADNFDAVCSELKAGGLGYGSDIFKTDKGVAVVGTGEKNRKLTLTTGWSGSGTVSWECSSDAASISFDEDSWSSSVGITIVPQRAGVTVVTFSNDMGAGTFKVLIIVTD